MLDRDLKERAKLPIVLYVDVLPFRRHGSCLEFLLFKRRPDVVMPDTWQPACGKLTKGLSISASFRDQAYKKTGVSDGEIVPIDSLNSYYDHHYDCVMLVPCAGFEMKSDSPVRIDEKLHCEFRWVSYEDIPRFIKYRGQLNAYDALICALRNE